VHFHVDFNYTCFFFFKKKEACIVEIDVKMHNGNKLQAP